MCVILRGGLQISFTTVNSSESVPKSSTGSAALHRELAVADVMHLHPLASCTVAMKPYRKYQDLFWYVSSKAHGGELRRYENIPQHVTLPSITGTESISLFCKKSVHAIFRVRFSPLFLGGRCCGSGAGPFCGGEPEPLAEHRAYLIACAAGMGKISFQSERGSSELPHKRLGASSLLEQKLVLTFSSKRCSVSWSLLAFFCRALFARRPCQIRRPWAQLKLSRLSTSEEPPHGRRLAHQTQSLTISKQKR
jgi:hypothetical protein